MIIVRSSFSNSSVFKTFSSALKSVFEKLRSVWTVGLTVEIKLCFQISPTKCGRDLRN